MANVNEEQEIFVTSYLSAISNKTIESMATNIMYQYVSAALTLNGWDVKEKKVRREIHTTFGASFNNKTNEYFYGGDKIMEFILENDGSGFKFSINVFDVDTGEMFPKEEVAKIIGEYKANKENNKTSCREAAAKDRHKKVSSQSEPKSQVQEPQPTLKPEPEVKKLNEEMMEHFSSVIESDIEKEYEKNIEHDFSYTKRKAFFENFVPKYFSKIKFPLNYIWYTTSEGKNPMKDVSKEIEIYGEELITVAKKFFEKYFTDANGYLYIDGDYLILPEDRKPCWKEYEQTLLANGIQLED